MQTAKKLVQERKEVLDRKIYHRTSFRSKRNPDLSYVTTIYFGGKMDRPNASCDCPRFTFKKWCAHVDKVWNLWMSGFQKMHVVHHDELYEKRGWQTN